MCVFNGSFLSFALFFCSNQDFGGAPPTNPIPPTQAVLAVVEADHDVYDETTRKEISQALQRIKIDGAEANDNDESDDMEMQVRAVF